MIELEAASFQYPGADASIGPLSLGVARGEMLAVVGPNGSGKSTLVRMISGALAAASGKVSVLGIDPARSDRRSLARKLAVLGQQPALGFPFTVLEVVLMGRAPHLEGFHLESDRDVEAATAAMEATQVAHLATRAFDTLSSGERQRVAVARALAQEPELLVMDEPAVFLDIKQQTALYDLTTRLNRDRGMTVVSVMHDLNIASLYFDRVAMMKQGRLAAVGTPEEVITYQRIRDVFETDVYVDLNDLTGKLNVLPLPESRSA